MKKKINIAPTKMINKVVDTTKMVASKANGFALNTTEEVVTDTIEVAGQWQTVTSKAIKGGLQLAANQQDLIFDALEGVKSTMLLTKKRFSKLVA
ncbi:hypothetical protein ACFQO1_07475 [Jejudonia soesokkakensis]|uniref:Uncharacterized protein n=1 Tax=Jejudonia soesokkakensis TaxID=1323432 RepID=A0ABW2MV13_9FLAO